MSWSTLNPYYYYSFLYYYYFGPKDQRNKRLIRSRQKIEKGGTARHLFESYFLVRNWDTVGPSIWSTLKLVNLPVWRVKTLRPLKKTFTRGVLKP